MPFEARNIVNVRVLFCAGWLWVQVTRLYELLCYGTVIWCISHRLLMLCLSLVNCCSIFCYLMIHLYSLLSIIYSLLYAYIDLCLFLCCWLITSHKSTPDLGIDPSRVTVKFQRATLGIPSRHPSFLFGGFKVPEGSPFGSRAWFSSGTPNNFFFLSIEGLFFDQGLLWKSVSLHGPLFIGGLPIKRVQLREECAKLGLDSTGPVLFLC